MLKVTFLAFLISIIIFSGCDNYSHNSYVNTDPVNYIIVTKINSTGGSNDDMGLGIINTSNNGYIALGSTKSYGLDLDSNSLYLTFIDSNGTVNWTNVFGGWGNDIGEAIIQTQSGDLLLAGVSSSFWLSTGIKLDPKVHHHKFPILDYNSYLIKLNSDGEIYWEKVYGDSTLLEWSTSIIEYSNGFVLAGFQGENSNIDEPVTNDEFFVIKTDMDGNLIWQQSYGTSNQDRAQSIVATEDGGYIVGGYSLNHRNGIGSPYIIKINSNGDLVWENVYGIQGVDQRIMSMVSTSDGGYVGVGYSRTVIDNEPSISNLYAIKINEEGSVLWENIYPQSNLSVGHCIIENSDSSLVISGITTKIGKVNITKLNLNGSLFWSQNTIFLGSGMGLVAINGGYALTGQFFNLLNVSVSDMLIMEIYEDFTNIEP